MADNFICAETLRNLEGNKEFRGLGLGNQLLQSIIDDLRGRGIKAVETFARKGRAENPSGPVEFYLRNGFRIYKDDPQFPLIRLELKGISL